MWLWSKARVAWRNPCGAIALTPEVRDRYRAAYEDLQRQWYERWPGVGVQWAMFSVRGRNERAGGLVIDSFSMRDTLDQGLIKSIVDPQRTVRCIDAHWFEYEYGLPVDESGWPLAPPATKATSLSRLRLNHYASRSEKEAREKIARQSGWSHLGRWRRRDLSGELELVRDESIAPWIPPLRASLEAIGARR